MANFVTASEAREKKAKAAEARVAKKASASAAAKREKAEDATSPGAKRPRGKLLGSKNGEKKATATVRGAAKQEPARAHESGSNHPKTPGDIACHRFHEKTAANGERRGETRVSFVSPPSTAKSGGDGATAAAARAAIASASVDASDARRDDRPTPAKKARRGPGPGGPVARERVTTTTTTIALDVREDDMGALAHRLADYVGSYGSMDARDLLGVPCGGQMLRDALARAASDVFF